MRCLLGFVFALLIAAATGCTNCKGCRSTTTLAKEVAVTKEPSEEDLVSFLVSGDWPCDIWWEMFDDSQLTTFIETALKDNPGIRSLESRVKRANQEAFIARSKLFPSLSAAMQIVLAYFPKEVIQALAPNLGQQLHLYNVPLDFSYEFDFWRKNRTTYEAALGEENVQKMQKRHAELLLATGVSKVYFDIQAHMIKLTILEQLLASRTRQLELVSIRKERRIDSQVNINDLTEQVSSLQEVLAGMKEELEIQKHLLNILLGKGPGEELVIDLRFKEYTRPVAIPDDAGIGLIARRPDIMAEIWQLYQASKMIGVAASQFYPNVAVKSFAGFQSLKYQDLFKPDTLTGILIPYFDVPIFTGGRLRANLRSKVNAYESLVHHFNDTLLKAGKSVCDAVVKCNAAAEKLEYQKDRLSSVRSNYEMAYTRYQHGIESMISVLASDQQFLWTRIKQIELERMKYVSIIELIQSLGGGFTDEKGIKVLKNDG